MRPPADRADRHRDVVGRVPARLLTHPRVPGGIGRVGHRTGVDARPVDLPGQRRRRRVEVQAAVDGHPPAHAPLVRVDVVAVDLADLAPVRGTAAGRDEPDIGLQRGGRVRLHLGELLGEVRDPRLARLQPQRRAQPLVGAGVDAGHPRATQVERDPVRLAVVEGCPDPVARRHRHGRLSTPPRACRRPPAPGTARWSSCWSRRRSAGPPRGTSGTGRCWTAGRGTRASRNPPPHR